MTTEEQKRLADLALGLFDAVDDYFDTTDFCESGNELASNVQAIYYELLNLKRGKPPTEDAAA